MPETSGAAQVDAVRLMADVTLTLHIRRQRELTARLWLARQLIRLAAWVGGFGRVEIEEST